MGSGQTAVAAMKTDRHYIGYEIDEAYLKLAESRIREFQLEFSTPDLFRAKETGSA